MKKLKPDEQLIIEIKEKIGDEPFQRNFGKGAEEVLNELIEKSNLTFEDELKRKLKEVLESYISSFEMDINKAISDLNYIWRKEDLVLKILKLDDDIFVVIVSYKDNEDGKAKIFAKAVDTTTKEIWEE